MSERIQKLLASAGIASRRAIETMIGEGRVTVNGRPAEVGQRVSHADHIRVDSRLVSLSRKAEATRVLLYRKKVGELVTRDDPEGRKTVFRKLPELEGGRWIAVGRLDINTSGLLLLTNDGELARRLMHPSFEMRREYAVRVLGNVDAPMLARLRAGVDLEDGFAKFETIEAGANNQTLGEEMDGPANSWWTVTVKQGRNRVVRRLLESQNLQVSRLMRVSYGPIALGRGIKSGSYREADAEELQALLEAVGIPVPAAVRKQVKTAAPSRRRSFEREESVESSRPARRESWQDGESTRPAKRRPGPPKPGQHRAAPSFAAEPAERSRDRASSSRSTKKPAEAAVFDPAQSIARLVAKPTPREARFPLPAEEATRPFKRRIDTPKSTARPVSKKASKPAPKSAPKSASGGRPAASDKSGRPPARKPDGRGSAGARDGGKNGGKPGRGKPRK